MRGRTGYEGGGRRGGGRGEKRGREEGEEGAGGGRRGGGRRERGGEKGGRGKEENFACARRAPLQKGGGRRGGGRGEVRGREGGEAYPLSTPSIITSPTSRVSVAEIDEIEKKRDISFIPKVQIKQTMMGL